MIKNNKHWGNYQFIHLWIHLMPIYRLQSSISSEWQDWRMSGKNLQYLNIQVLIIDKTQFPHNIILSANAWGTLTSLDTIVEQIRISKNVLLMMAEIGKWVSCHFFLLFQTGALKQMCRFVHACEHAHMHECTRAYTHSHTRLERRLYFSSVILHRSNNLLFLKTRKGGLSCYYSVSIIMP